MDAKAAGPIKQVWEGAVGTAKRCRAVLKAKFPSTKFAVRSKTYSGGSSVYIDWTDGPLTEAVNKLVKPFEGASFDGMIDLMSYVDVVVVDESGELVQIHGANYILTQRSRSTERDKLIEAELRQYWCEKEAEEAIKFHDCRLYAESEARMMKEGKL